MSLGIGSRFLDLKVNETLWIAGPAKIVVDSGIVEVFGARIVKGESIIVKRCKSIYLKALSDCRIGVSSGAYVMAVEDDGIPDDWRKLVSEISNVKGKVMVLGGLDSGKNTLVTFLSNNLFNNGFKVGVLDADVGQNELGPPTTMALGLVKRPVSSLDQLDAVGYVFVGSTSPVNVRDRVFNGLRKLMDLSSKFELDYLIINTTGWISNGGVDFKIEKIKLVKPEVLIGIERSGELEPIFSSIKMDCKVFRVPSSRRVRARDRFDRRIIRQMNYVKWFEDASNKKFSIDDFIGFEPNIFQGTPMGDGEIDLIGKILGVKVAFSIRRGDDIIVFPYSDLDFNEDVKERVVGEFNARRCLIIPFTHLIPLLVAFEDSNGVFMGLGILTNIDFKNRVLQFYTKVNVGGGVKVVLGLIRINPVNFDEIGYSKIPLN